MENLEITKTESTLEVDFDAEDGVLALSGSSYPENAERFLRLFDQHRYSGATAPEAPQC